MSPSLLLADARLHTLAVCLRCWLAWDSVADLYVVYLTLPSLVTF